MKTLNWKLFKHILVPYCSNAQNRRFDCEPVLKDGKPIYIFYHVYCGPNDYKGIISEQLGEMKKSGLFDVAKKVFVALIGSDEERQQMREDFLSDENKVCIFYESTDGTCYEFPCLKQMHTMAKEEDFYALYLHTKGASYSRARYDGKFGDYDDMVYRAALWRRVMNYWNISKWNMAVNVLSSGYDTYGCLLYEPTDGYPAHYSGNFWWSNSANIRKLHEIDDSYVKDRSNAEFWCMGTSTKAYCSFYYHVLLYLIHLRSSVYTKSWYYYKNIMYLFYCYMWRIESVIRQGRK